MKNISVKIAGWCLLGLSAASIAVSSVQAQTVLQFNRWLPPAHFFQKDVLEAWATDVEKATEGRVKIQVTASSLGPPQRQFDMVKQGVVDVVWSAHGYNPGRFVTSEGVELPFIGDSAEALSAAYWHAYEKFFAKANEYDGIKLLSLHAHPPGDLFTATKPLATLDDIKGLKIRINSGGTAEMIESLGGVPVSGPSSKTHELLTRGVVDGTVFTPDGVVQFNLGDHIKHQMKVEGGLFNSTFFLAMNQRAWDSLSAQDQKIIEQLSGEAFARRAGGIWDAETARSQKILNDKGVTTTLIEGKILDELKTRMGNVEQVWVDAVGKKGVDGAAALEAIREDAARQNKGG